MKRFVGATGKFMLSLVSWGLMMTQGHAQSLVVNGSFESGISPFYVNLNNGAGGTLMARSNAAPGGGARSAKLAVSKSLGNVWDVSAIQSHLAVTANQQYTVSFFAKASSSGRRLVASMIGYSPFTNYTAKSFSLTTQWQQYSFTYTQTASDGNAALVLASGAQTGSVGLDLVSVTPVNPPAPAPAPVPALSYSPSSLNFGSLAVGSSSPVQTLTMKNTGTADLIISTVALTGDFKWGAATPTMCVLGNSYAPGASCTMAIYFAPQSAGALSGSLTLTDNTGNPTEVVPFSGTGVSSDPAPIPAPAAGGLITNFTTTKWDRLLIDGIDYGVQTVGSKSYSLQEIDDHTLRFEIRQGDCVWSCGAVETSELQREPQWNPSTPITIEYQFMLEPGSTITSNWFVAGEMHNDDYAWPQGTSPPFAMQIAPGDYLQVSYRYIYPGGNPTNGSGTTVQTRLPWTSPTKIVRGQWYDIKVQANFSNVGGGYLYVFVDGVQVVNYSGMIGYGYQTYWMFGLYRETSSVITSAQYRNMTVSPK